MDGGVDTGKSNGTPYRVESRTGRFLVRDGTKNPGVGKTVQYSYRMVYTQESIRVLDLRLDIGELEVAEDLPELLRSAGIVFIEHAIAGELDEISRNLRKTLND